ncbi:MAG: endonuclease/exonuclease/phosphatase family protein [Flavisolibacter sp.]
MTRTILLIFASLFSVKVFSQTLITGTFNIRYDTPRDSINQWGNGASIVANLIRFHEFDILGTQEGLKNQLDDLEKSLSEYARYGIGRDDGQSKGEHSAIFYKKEKFTVIDSGDFWLNEHPEKPGFGWDSRHNRICTWVKLKEKKSKKLFYVFNVHYDHQGVQARNESSKLVLKKINDIAGDKPVIFMGDLNGNHESDWYKAIKNSGKLKDVLREVKHPYINNGSFNSFTANNPSKDIIDHIFVSKHFKVERYGILTDTYHNKFPSDHFPVLATVRLDR